MASTKELSEKTNQRRLLLAKQLFQHGLEHSQKSDPLDKMIAVHNFHNAIEITIKAIMLFFEIRSEKQLNLDFESMLNAVDKFDDFKVKDRKLPYRQEIRNLATARNMVQHGGVEPEKSSTENWHVFTKRFLEITFKDYFELEFDEMSSVSLIQDSRLLKLMEKANKNLLDGNWLDSIKLARLAFEYSICAITNFLKIDRRGSNQFNINSYRFNGSNNLPGEFFRAMEELYEDLKQNQEMLLLQQATGIGIIDYNRLDSIFPKVNIAMNGTPHFYSIRSNANDNEDAFWMFEFATNNIISWQLNGLNPKVPEQAIAGCDEFLEQENNN
jgi:hypothetical protein